MILPNHQDAKQPFKRQPTLHFFYEKYHQAFQTLKDVLTSMPILITPNWSQPFKLMCDISDVV